jgi:hypothetical protein
LARCAKALDAEQLPMLVLDGPQDLGKSTLDALALQRAAELFHRISDQPDR